MPAMAHKEIASLLARLERWAVEMSRSAQSLAAQAGNDSYLIEASNGSNEVAHNLAKAATAIRRLIAERDRLREQIVLAANRLDVCVVNAIADGQHKLSVTYKDWAAEARAALGEGGGE